MEEETLELWSPPARGRGLKHSFEGKGRRRNGSPPARGRGLKLIPVRELSEGLSRPLRGGVD